MRKLGWIVEEGEDRNHYVIWTVIHPEIGRKPLPARSARSAGAKSGDVCTVCAGPLLVPHSQQRGYLREVLATYAGRRGKISMTAATAKLDIALITWRHKAAGHAVPIPSTISCGPARSNMIEISRPNGAAALRCRCRTTRTGHLTSVSGVLTSSPVESGRG
jgi:hypothetical protein